jgi:phage terminase large subunit
MFECSQVYHANYIAKADIIVNQGGTDSGKTYGIMQLLYTFATRYDAPAIDPIITIVGSSVPNLNKGAYRHGKNIMSSTKDLDKYIKAYNQTNKTITFVTGWIMEFISCQTEQEAKQGKRQYLFINEANGISYPIFWQLAKRTRRQTFIDYNPSFSFWAHEKLIGTTPVSNDLGATVQMIISDHRHNKFLSPEDHRKTESIKDPELWKVYARGLTGKLSGLIFPEWQQIPDIMFPKDEPFFGGLDFGYTNDPTAGVKIARIGETLYIHELCYTPGIAPIQMKQIFDANGFDGETIYCEHDPDQVAQLRRLELRTVLARKGQGSVNAGIIKLKEYKIFYTESSKNLKIELSKYMWEIAEDTGKPTNTPVDAFNHLIDAIRYGVYSQFYRE